jgi:hypothetical protein
MVSPSALFDDQISLKLCTDAKERGLGSTLKTMKSIETAIGIWQF